MISLINDVTPPWNIQLYPHIIGFNIFTNNNCTVKYNITFNSIPFGRMRYFNLVWRAAKY